MRRRTVVGGLYLIGAGVLLVGTGTFLPLPLAALLGIGPGKVTIACLVSGGLTGGYGVMVTVVGLLQGSDPADRTRVLTALIILGGCLFLFALLLWSATRHVVEPPLPPGKTIVI